MGSPLQLPVMQRLVRLMLKDGKKTKAESVALRTLEYLRVQKKVEDPVGTLHLATERLSPLLEVKSVRVRGRTFRVPIPVTANRSEGLGLKWLILSARKKKRPMCEALGDEILLASKGQGDAIKKRDEVINNAGENRAFAHYRW